MARRSRTPGPTCVAAACAHPRALKRPERARGSVWADPTSNDAACRHADVCRPFVDGETRTRTGDTNICSRARLHLSPLTICRAFSRFCACIARWPTADATPSARTQGRACRQRWRRRLASQHEPAPRHHIGRAGVDQATARLRLLLPVGQRSSRPTATCRWSPGSSTAFGSGPAPAGTAGSPRAGTATSRGSRAGRGRCRRRGSAASGRWPSAQAAPIRSAEPPARGRRPARSAARAAGTDRRWASRRGSSAPCRG